MQPSIIENSSRRLHRQLQCFTSANSCWRKNIMTNDDFDFSKISLSMANNCHLSRIFQRPGWLNQAIKSRTKSRKIIRFCQKIVFQMQRKRKLNHIPTFCFPSLYSYPSGYLSGYPSGYLVLPSLTVWFHFH